jgi:hypothetical protein
VISNMLTHALKLSPAAASSGSTRYHVLLGVE